MPGVLNNCAVWILEKIDFGHGRVNPCGAERDVIHIINGGDSRKDQNGFQTRLEACEDIGTQIIPDNHGLF